jgi:hypothetical protein
MICKSCSAEIPPQWLFALSTNLCPGCGSALMNEDEKSLLDELTAAMERMPNNPRGIAGWILSNFRVLKINSSLEPTERFYTKNGNNGAQTPSGQVNDFQKRAQYNGPTAKIAEVIAAKAGGNSKIAELAAAISQTSDPYESQEPAQQEAQASANNVNGVTQEDINAVLDLQKQGFSNMFSEGIAALPARQNQSSQSSQSEFYDSQQPNGDRVVSAIQSMLEDQIMVTLPDGSKATKEEANYLQSLAQNRPQDYQTVMRKKIEAQSAFDGGRSFVGRMGKTG